MQNLTYIHFGIVMYEMVTGRVPFDADTPVSVALKHMQEEPVEPIVINSSLPIVVNKIILKAMKKDPNYRYQSATELLIELKSALKNQEINLTQENNNKNEDITKKIDKNQLNKTNKNSKFIKIKDFFDKHKILKIFAIIFSAIFVFAISMIITFAILIGTRQKDVQIPDLNNLTFEEAEKIAEKLKLKVELLEEKYDIEILEGKVTEQDPKYQENFKIKEGTKIKVTISKGQEIIIVPDLIGKTKDEAIKILKEIQLNVKFEEENSDDIEKGKIIKQNIEKDLETLAGSDIIITVSLGIEQIAVPNLIGKTEKEAKETISSSKLKYKATLKTSDSSKTNNTIVNQDIVAGSYVDKNTEITITLNEFDEIKSGTIIVNMKSITGGYKVPPEPETITDTTLKVVLGADPVYEQTVDKNSTSILIPISGIGTLTVKIYVEGVLKTPTQQFNFNNMTTLNIF